MQSCIDRYREINSNLSSISRVRFSPPTTSPKQKVTHSECPFCFADAPSARTHSVRGARGMGSHTPPEDLKARFQGVGDADIRALREFPVAFETYVIPMLFCAKKMELFTNS